MWYIWSKLPSVLLPIPHCLGLPFSSHIVASFCSRDTQRILFVSFGIHRNPQFLLTLAFLIPSMQICVFPDILFLLYSTFYIFFKKMSFLFLSSSEGSWYKQTILSSTFLFFPLVLMDLDYLIFQNLAALLNFFALMIPPGESFLLFFFACWSQISWNLSLVFLPPKWWVLGLHGHALQRSLPLHFNLPYFLLVNVKSNIGDAIALFSLLWKIWKNSLLLICIK